MVGNGTSWGSHFGLENCWASVWCHIDTEQEGRDGLRITYNLSDCSGEHDFPARKPRKGPIADSWELFLRMKEAAVSAAENEIAYKFARFRETPLKCLEYAFLVTIGRGRTTVHTDELPNSSSTISGVFASEGELIAEVDRLGIPFVDSRTVPNDRISVLAISGPIWPCKPEKFDAAPWGGLSKAPLSVMAGLYRHFGAIVRNFPEVTPFDPANFRALSIRESTALHGWATNNEALVARAMIMTE
jgi:hypothetical protein